jgi:hypothetical protein
VLDMVADQPGVSMHVLARRQTSQNNSAYMPAKVQPVPLPATANAGITAWGQATSLIVL